MNGDKMKEYDELPEKVKNAWKDSALEVIYILKTQIENKI